MNLQEEAQMHLIMAVAIILLTSSTALGAKAKKCESLKGEAACTARTDCTWAQQGQSAQYKCRSLKAAPR